MAQLWAYEPLTDEEIIAYLRSLSLEQQLDEIRKLDWLEHEPPVFEKYKYLAVLDKDNELIVYPEKSLIGAKHAYLHYTVELPTFYFEDFEIPVKKRYILAGLTGGVIGIYGTAITGEEVWWKYFISGVGGLSIGLLAEYLFR